MLALLHVGVTFRTSMEAVFQAALSDFAPCSFLVLSASPTFPLLVFPACPAVESAGGDEFWAESETTRMSFKRIEQYKTYE